MVDSIGKVIMGTEREAQSQPLALYMKDAMYKDRDTERRGDGRDFTEITLQK